MALIVLARTVPRLRGRAGDATAVQAMHVGLTPRVGGVAIFGALAFSLFFAPEALVRQYAEFIIATAMIFVIGLREDLGFHVSPRIRLLAVVIASLIVIALIGDWLRSIGWPFADQLLSYWFIGIPFTLLITAGVSNGFNLIDGVNGLAAVTAIGGAISIALIAQQANYVPTVVLSMMLAAVVVGFLVLNYPFGWIFLGDAGAYTIGFVLSWLGIATLLNAPAVSPWAILLTMFWPLADTLLAMYRRNRSNRGAMLPDRLHMHQLIMRGIEIRILGRNRRHLSNPLTTAALTPFVLAPPIAGTLLWDHNLAAFCVVIMFLGLFFGFYTFAVGAIRKNRKRP
ncbi:MraY family glycosyltransferase [Roseobacter sp. CCS2]|uniref:MraY family glycosyltransferase n=1 Tax=Roseobacter sp. CCS2 TaxID=391593 RepID=UPI0018DBD146|nr:glycosyltransferase [Roseobacter sp. CCS2]